MKATDLIEEILLPLRKPVLQAHRAARKALERDDVSGDVRQAVLMIRSMCARAENVFSGAHLLQDVNSLSMESRLKKSTVGNLFSLIDEMVDDMTVLLDPERQLRINVDEPSFQAHSRLHLHLDLSLVEIAARNVIDNAVRYSFRNSRVEVAARRVENVLSVVVSNQGLQTTAEELRKIAESGYRGNSAMVETGEDSGIGLWLVSRIMEVHQGRLRIMPGREGMTEVHLEFPAGD